MEITQNNFQQLQTEIERLRNIINELLEAVDERDNEISQLKKEITYLELEIKQIKEKFEEQIKNYENPENFCQPNNILLEELYCQEQADEKQLENKLENLRKSFEEEKNHYTAYIQSLTEQLMNEQSKTSQYQELQTTAAQYKSSYDELVQLNQKNLNLTTLNEKLNNELIIEKQKALKYKQKNQEQKAKFSTIQELNINKEIEIVSQKSQFERLLESNDKMLLEKIEKITQLEQKLEYYENHHQNTEQFSPNSFQNSNSGTKKKQTLQKEFLQLINQKDTEIQFLQLDKQEKVRQPTEEFMLEDIEILQTERDQLLIKCKELGCENEKLKASVETQKVQLLRPTQDQEKQITDLQEFVKCNKDIIESQNKQIKKYEVEIEKFAINQAYIKQITQQNEQLQKSLSNIKKLYGKELNNKTEEMELLIQTLFSFKDQITELKKQKTQENY